MVGSIGIRAGVGTVTLAYNYTPSGCPAEVVHQPVTLTTTPCALGGNRTWFACPACNKRVAVIYGAGRLFACRKCKGLAYGIAAAGAGIGIGLVVSSTLSGIARQPEQTATLRTLMFIGVGFIEVLALIGLALVFIM